MPFHSVEYCLILYMRAHAKAVTGETFTRLRRSRLESVRARAWFDVYDVHRRPADVAVEVHE